LCNAGEQGDDAQAHDCLRYHALEGDSALFDQAPTMPIVDPATANGPALANSPAATYVPGPFEQQEEEQGGCLSRQKQPRHR